MQTEKLVSESWLARFADHLQKHGYSEPANQQRLSTARLFVSYLRERAVAIESASVDDVESFLQSELQRCQQRLGHEPRNADRWCSWSRRRIALFLHYVQGKWPPPRVPAGKDERFHYEICKQYQVWLTTVRGLAEQTITHRCRHALELLRWLGDRAGGDTLNQLRLSDIDAYLRIRTQPLRRITKVELALNIRSFLSYLHGQSLITNNLAPAVSRPKLYAYEGIPSALTTEEIDRVLRVTRQDPTPMGRRDFAMLMVLAVYGIRAGEMIRLRLDDIDWQGDRFHVRISKTNAEGVFPLLAPVGNAILNYLRWGRPETESRALFVSTVAPYQAFARSLGVYNVVSRRLAKAGVRPAGKRGPHAFRHACAVRLLRAGISLKAIGEILGHRSSASTNVYLKLAIEDLRGVGLDVPSIAGAES